MTITRFAMAGLPNSVAADIVTITAGAEGASMKAAKLKTPEPWDVARLTSVFPHQSYWEVDFGPTAAIVRALALVSHSLIPGDQLRVVTVDAGALPAVRSQTLPPTAIEASVNMQATSVLVLDEHPSTTDNSLALPTVETDPWSIRLSFGTPSSTPAVGGDYQCFLARVRQVNTSQSSADFPTVKASLYEGGVLRKVLGTKAFTLTDPGTTGRFVIFPWNATELQTADGSAVELLLEFEPGGGLAYGGLDSTSWEVLSATDKAIADSDTGWITVAGAETEADFGGTALQEIDLPPPLWNQWIDPAITVAKARVEFRADGMGLFTSFLATPPRTPSDLIDVGELRICPVWEAPENFAPEATLRVVPYYVGGDTAITGSNRAVIQYRRREADINFLRLPPDDAHALFARLDYAAAGTVPVLVSLEPTATGAGWRNTTFLATVVAESGHSYQNVRGPGGELTSRGAAYRLVEVL